MKNDVRASIDIGSNSVLLLIAEVSGKKLKELLKRSEITSLGKELDKNQAFHPESMQATFEALKSYAEDCDRLGVPRNEVIITATEASRVARNAREFFAEIQQKLGLNVSIINAGAEAYFSMKGILFNTEFKSDVITLMDIGGASTELIKVNTRNLTIIETISLPVGSVRSTQWLSDSLFVQNLQKVFLDFRNEIDKFQGKELYAVAGTVTALANMHLGKQEFIEEDVHGAVLKAEDIDTLFKKYHDSTPEQLLAAFPFLGKRARSIRGGLHLTYHIVHRLLTREMIVSTYGLRFGSLLEGKIKEEHLHKQA